MAGKTEPGVWTQMAREMLRQQQLAVPRRIEREGIHPALLTSAVLAALAMSTSAVATVTCTASGCTFTSTGETNASAIVTTSSFAFESNSYGATNTQSGNISGSGSVGVSGSVYPGSTLILSGVNTYTGGTFVNGNSSLQIGTASTTGSLPGNVTFFDTTFNGYEAGSLTLINTVGAGGSDYSGTIVHAGAVNLAGTTTLGGATIDGSSSVSGEGNGKLTLTDSASAGSSTISNISQLTMSSTSTLGNSTVTNVADVEMDGSASTGNSIVSGYSTAVFASNTTAGSSTLTGASSGSQIEFLDQSSAQTATINNDSAAGANAALFFNGTATAASSTINNGSASDAIQANTIAAPSRNTVEFWSDSTAANATINNYNGYVLFDYNSTAANAQINNHNDGIIDFFTDASAGTAHILNDTGSSITLEGASTADQATIVNEATADVDISQNTNTSVAIGNISGAGDVYLGSNTLVIGSNNGDNSIGALHDSYGPAFADLGLAAETGGSLLKEGTGTLVLSGNSDYTGGTTIAAGTLQVGAGGTTGALLGAVADSGSLVFERSDSYDFTGAVSGSGSLTQAGTGTLMLSGNNTNTGGITIASGTLQLGDGGASGSVVGAIADNGNLSIDRSDTYVLGNAVSGSGSLTQAGSGTTIINTTQAYTGGTSITAGTLQLGEGGTEGVVSGAIVDNANLNLDFSGTYTLANAVSGTGSVSQVSSGTLVIDDNQTYTGGTHINAGTVQVGTGGTSGSIVGNVADNGSLVFDRSDTYDFGGTISGSGSVTQAGSGVLVFSADNSYSGGTDIASGELEITDGGYVPGAVSNNGTLAFDSSGASSFDGSLSGSGTVIQQGSGTLTWNATSTDTGATSLAAGALVLGDASHASANLGGDLQQAAGTTLSGFGTIDGNADLDGVIAPGDSNTVGALHINGNLVLGADSQLQAKVLPNGSNDELLVGGSAKLDGSVLVLAQNQNYQANIAYTLVDAQQGVSGQFGAVSANFAFVDPTLSYTADTAVLTLLRNTTAFQDVGITLNQINTGRAIGALNTDNAIYQAVEVSAADQARADYDQLSGEIHASALSSVLQNSLAIEDTINQQVFSPAGTELDGDRSSGRTWMQALGGGGSFSANAQVGAAATHGTSSGVIGGADMAVADNAEVGVLAGTQVSSLSDVARDSTASIHNRFVGAYAGGRDGSLVANGGIVYGENSIQTTRRLQTPAIAQTLDANYHAPLEQAFVQAGWAMPLGQGVAMPYLNATVAHVGADRFSESGGDAALSASNQGQTARLSTLGVQGQWAVAKQGGESSLNVNANLGWQHAYGGVTPRRTLNFVAGGDAFDIYGNALARNAAVASVGAGVRLSKRASLDLRLSERIGGGARDANASATLTIAI